MHKLSIEYQSPLVLKENDRNANRHPATQIEKLARSIESVGFVVPVLVDKENVLVAGHGRIEAAKALKLAEVPTVRVEHLSEAQKRTLMIADNKLAELSVFDSERLALELEELLDLDCGLEITDTGFELAEVDVLIEDLRKPSPSEESIEDLIPSSAERVARPGDLWKLGDHLLFCGDALDPQSYDILLNNEKAQVVFADPPYGVRVNGHVSGKGKVRHREFVMGSDMSRDERLDFLRTACTRMAAASADGAINFICMDWRGIASLIDAAEPAYTELLNLCCWVKQHGGMGSLYRSQHELVAVFKVGCARQINNVALGKYGRTRTNVWPYPGMNSFQRGRDEMLAMHPTVKPVALVADALLDCSHRGGLVLDPFGGSGTTLIAAQRTGRRAAVIELDPLYVDVALRRFCDATGIEPVNMWTGHIVRHRAPPSSAIPVTPQKGINNG